MAPRWARAAAFFFIGIFSFLPGCASSPDSPSPFDSRPTETDPRSILIPRVPFFPQESFQCGPASLAAVLNFWGGRLQPDEISGRIYSERLRGTLPLDLEAEAGQFGKDRGLRVRVQRNDPGFFREELSGGRPLLVFVDLGFWVRRKGHFMVLLGYDDGKKGVWAHSGRNRETFIPYRTFLSQWKRTGYWALSISPESTKDATDRNENATEK